jgi:hypothetical protein
MILEDSSMNIGLGKQSYQINGVIGYPVFQALGRISFLHDGQFVAGNDAPATGNGAKMYMKGLSPIVICHVELPFTFDSGASGTDLYVSYYRLFRGESKNWKKAKEKEGGAGGVIKRKIYLQPELKLGIGDKTVVLKKASIYRTGTGTDTDKLYGNLAQDIPVGFSSFTLDFTNMTFSLGQPLASARSSNAECKQDAGVKR